MALGIERAGFPHPIEGGEVGAGCGQLAWTQFSASPKS